MQIPENSPIKEITIQGVKFQAPAPITDEMFCDSAEQLAPRNVLAEMLNSTMMESWRSGFSKHVLEKIKEAGEKLGIEVKKISDLSDDDAAAIYSELDTEALQQDFEAYIAAYTPGIVRRGSGGPALSPVDREARRIAKEIIMDHLEREKGIGRNARSATYQAWAQKVQEELGMTAQEYIEEMIQSLLEANPSIYETAEQNIRARQELTNSISLSV